MNFSSIDQYIQQKIVERMDYFSTKQFELSSKHGRQIVSFSKNAAIIDVRNIEVQNCGINFLFGVGKKKVTLWWYYLRQMAHLPRFKVASVTITLSERTRYSFDEIMDLSENAIFVNNSIRLNWDTSFYEGPKLLVILMKIFKTMRFWAPPPFSWFTRGLLPEISKMESVDIPIDGFTDEELVQIKCNKISFRQYADTPRIWFTANLFLKEWYHKKRSLEWLEVYNDSPKRILSSCSKESLFTDIHYSYIGCIERDTKQKGLLSPIFNLKSKILKQDTKKQDFVYSIDRGDKKLMVVCRADGRVIAQEYLDLKEAFTSLSDEYIQLLFRH